MFNIRDNPLYGEIEIEEINYVLRTCLAARKRLGVGLPMVEENFSR